MTKRYKLPKRIAWVKLSKQARKRGGRFIADLAGNGGRKVAVAGLGALAVALAASPRLRGALGGIADSLLPSREPTRTQA